MNLLTDRLPEAVTVDGMEYPINSDFRTGIAFELLMQRQDLADEEKAYRALGLFYPTIPENIEGALNGLLNFWAMERDIDSKPKKQEKQGAKHQRLYDFEQDAGRLYAAFLGVYGIDLQATSLHWWSFRALMEALPPDCAFCKVMEYRSIKPGDTKGMSKKQKAFYAKMRERYRLDKQDNGGRPKNLAEYNARLLAAVEKIFAEAEQRGNAEEVR